MAYYNTVMSCFLDSSMRPRAFPCWCSATPRVIRVLCVQLADGECGGGEGATPAWNSPTSLPLTTLLRTSLCPRLEARRAGNRGRLERLEQELLPGEQSRGTQRCRVITQRTRSAASGAWGSARAPEECPGDPGFASHFR